MAASGTTMEGFLVRFSFPPHGKRQSTKPQIITLSTRFFGLWKGPDVSMELLRRRFKANCTSSCVCSTNLVGPKCERRRPAVTPR
eukprot:4179551-Amphidinium_carterae.1